MAAAPFDRSGSLIRVNIVINSQSEFLTRLLSPYLQSQVISDTIHVSYPQISGIKSSKVLFFFHNEFISFWRCDANMKRYFPARARTQMPVGPLLAGWLQHLQEATQMAATCYICCKNAATNLTSFPISRAVLPWRDCSLPCHQLGCFSLVFLNLIKVYLQAEVCVRDSKP